MIASIKGRVGNMLPNSIVIEVGGVGLQVFVPTQLLKELRLGDQVHLHTYLVVRQDDLALYGFLTAEEREFFVLLLGVNGIGPKLALAGLSTLNPETIRRAVVSEQVEIFNRIPGVGKKTAQKIFLHLQDKVKTIKGLETIATLDSVDTQVLEALVVLGYSVVEAQAALQSIPRDAPEDIETRIRLALQYFSV